MKMYELLDSPDKLCIERAAVDKNGNPVNIFNPEAYTWCLIGAIFRCYPDITGNATIVHTKIYEELGGKDMTVFLKENSYETVIKLLRKLDI